MITQTLPTLMPFTRKVFHALEAMVYIALHHSTLPISGKVLAQTQGLPPRYLEQMMQRLVHGGLLRSIRGPRGGYVLAKERRRITLSEIVTSLQHDDAEDGIREHCTPLGEHLLMPVCLQAGALIHQELNKTTLAQLCDEAFAKHLSQPAQKSLSSSPSSSSPRADFAI